MIHTLVYLILFSYKLLSTGVQENFVPREDLDRLHPRILLVFYSYMGRAYGGK